MLNFVRRAWSGPVHQGDLEQSLLALGMDGTRDAIVHSSLSSFGYVTGGAPSVIDALRRAARTIVTPAFTYYTLVWPESKRQPDWPKILPMDGPTFRPDSPVSSDIGRVAQTILEKYPSRRSDHPALSFLALGEHADEILAAQTLENPYAPIGVLYQRDADVILLGVDQRSNTTIHYGEYLAGRPLLDRYAATRSGIEHTFFPNCSAAFGAIQGRLTTLETVNCGKAQLTRMRVREVVDETINMLRRNPEALLCSYAGCRCQAVRDKVRRQGLRPRTDWVLEAVG